MKSIGYARSANSTGNLDSQVEALRAAGCDPIFAETASGMADALPELEKALDHLGKDDELVINDLARLGRDAMAVLAILKAIEERGAKVRSLANDLPDGIPAVS
jgi:DNA invertase Pin-like site-specific DNA recombinase